MSRKLNRFKIQRQLQITLPGFGDKKANGPLETRPNPPGMHGENRRRKYSDYCERLREKQKIRFHYQLREKQIRNYIKKAKKKSSYWFIPFAQMLECRLDTILFRLGFFPTMGSARQAVTHGHVKINDQKCDRPSLIVKIGDQVTLEDKTYENILFEKTQENPTLELPAFLETEKTEKKVTGKLVSLPTEKDIPFQLNEQYFIEFYGNV
jgi:small subunit ribosomal protein S4